MLSSAGKRGSGSGSQDRPSERVPREPAPYKGLAGGTQKDLGPRPYSRGLSRPHLHESWDEGPREARALGQWGSRGGGSRKRVPTPQGAMRSWGVPQARLWGSRRETRQGDCGGLGQGPLTHSLWPSQLHSTSATDHTALLPAQQPGTSTRAGTLSPHRQLLTSGQCLQLPLQHDTGVVGPEHPGRQAIPRVLQVPVRAGSLKVGGRWGSACGFLGDSLTALLLGPVPPPGWDGAASQTEGPRPLCAREGAGQCSRSPPSSDQPLGHPVSTAYGQPVKGLLPGPLLSMNSCRFRYTYSGGKTPLPRRPHPQAGRSLLRMSRVKRGPQMDICATGPGFSRSRQSLVGLCAECQGWSSQAGATPVPAHPEVAPCPQSHSSDDTGRPGMSVAPWPHSLHPRFPPHPERA